MPQTAIVFVHGTGVRKDGSDRTCALIEANMPDWRVVAAEWGDLAGSRRAQKSVPDFRKTGGSVLTDEDRRLQTWNLLYDDPSAELRFLALNLEEQPTPQALARLLDDALRGLYRPAIPDDLIDPLSAAGALDVFVEACEAVWADESYEKLRRGALPPEGPYLDALANAVVAQAAMLDEMKRGEGAALKEDAELRDAIVLAVRSKLGPVKAVSARGIIEMLGASVAAAFKATMYAGSSLVGTPYLKWHRGGASEHASPVAGDILVYQARGSKIRGLIRDRVLDLKSPVMLLGHSLGGVACFDLLAYGLRRNAFHASHCFCGRLCDPWRSGVRGMASSRGQVEKKGYPVRLFCDCPGRGSKLRERWPLYCKPPSLPARSIAASSARACGRDPAAGVSIPWVTPATTVSIVCKARRRYVDLGI
jgi:hypothetical protein